MSDKNPKLIVLSGLQGSGKSTLANALSKVLRIAVISVDPIESAIIQSGIERSFETGYAAYLVAKTIADEQLRLGNSVIIDAANYVKEAQKIWEDIATKYKCDLKVIECLCGDENEHRSRIEKRKRELHGIEEVGWEDVLRRKGESEAWDIEKLIIDTSTSADSHMDEVIFYIKSSPS